MAQNCHGWVPPSTVNVSTAVIFMVSPLPLRRRCAPLRHAPPHSSPSKQANTPGGAGAEPYHQPPLTMTASPEGQFHTPAYAPPQVVDTTGAGDVFHGAFLFGRARGW